MGNTLCKKHKTNKQDKPFNQLIKPNSGSARSFNYDHKPEPLVGANDLAEVQSNASEGSTNAGSKASGSKASGSKRGSIISNVASRVSSLFSADRDSAKEEELELASAKQSLREIEKEWYGSWNEQAQVGRGEGQGRDTESHAGGGEGQAWGGEGQAWGGDSQAWVEAGDAHEQVPENVVGGKLWNWASEIDNRSTIVKDNPRVSGILENIEDPVHPAELQEDAGNWPTEPRKSRRKSEAGGRRKSVKKPRKITGESKEPSHAPETLTRHTTYEMHADNPAEIESKVRRRRKSRAAKDGLESESRSRHKEHLSPEDKREHQKYAQELLDPNYDGAPLGRPQKRERRKTEDRHRKRSPKKTHQGENRERRPVRTEGGERRPRKSEGGEKRRRKSTHAKGRKSHHQ